MSDCIANHGEVYKIPLRGGFNPSINGRDVLVRTSNYDLDVAPTPGWEPETINYLGRLGERKVENLTPLNDGHRSRLVMKNGLEDGRLIRNGRLYGLFTAHYQNDDGKVAVFKNTMTLMDLESLEYRTFPTGKREKNWMPFVRDGEILALTTTKPWNIISLETGDTVKEGPGLDTFWSGSSQFVPFRDGWLGVVHRHETRFQRDGFWVCRDYTHAFLQMDQDLNPTNLSRPFRFFSEGVEFCNGIDWHGDDLCLSFGVHDKEGYLLWVGSSDLDSFLQSSWKPEPSGVTVLSEL